MKRPLLMLFLAAATASLPGLVSAQTARIKADASLEVPAGAIAVSDYELNTFVFGETIKNIFFPAGSPVLGTPIYLADNSQVMLQFAKGSAEPVQMVVELAGGQVVTLRVIPRKMAGIVHSVGNSRITRNGPITTVGAERKVSAEPARASSGAAAGSADVELLKVLVASGEPPAGFDPVVLPRPTQFDRFAVVPLKGWTDGASRRVLVFSLVAAEGETSVVSPPQFYRQGITAVMVDGDVVDANNSPNLYVVEEFSHE